MHADRRFCAFLSGLVLLVSLAVPALAFGASNPEPSFNALEVRLQGGISPVQVELIQDALSSCSSSACQMLLITLDTPGGLGESMRDIARLMLNAKVPVGVWVGPSGARAASAGVFIVAASSISGMSPGTTIGAASPVDVSGGDLSETMAKKVQSDMSSFVQALAADHGRNQQWYIQAVKESVSLTAREAVMENVVEILADSAQDFLVQAGARGVPFKGARLKFSQGQLRVSAYNPGFWYSFLSWLINPSIAYFFLLGGLAGLFFELSTPGAVLPGVIGGMCMILALYAMSVLPTNIAGVLLILFGVVLFILEIKIISHGLLSIAGIVCLFIGSTILFRFSPGFPGVPMSAIIVTTLGVSSTMGGAAYLVIKSQREKRNLGYDGMIGLSGVVQSWKGSQGMIRVRGELWSARLANRDSRTPLVFSEGDSVLVVGHEGLVLQVEPENSDGKKESASSPE